MQKVRDAIRKPCVLAPIKWIRSESAKPSTPSPSVDDIFALEEIARFLPNVGKFNQHGLRTCATIP